MERWKGVETARRFFSGTGSSYDLVVNLCTFGFDFWWKRRMLRSVPPNPARILDQASGTGILALKLARRFARARVTGVELRAEYLNIARIKAGEFAVNNVDFLLGRAEDIVLPSGIDCLTSSYLAKYAELGTLVSNAKKMLRPGGVLIMHDFTYPSGGLFLRLWRFYFRVLQSIGAMLFPEWKTTFDELPALLESSRWKSELVSCLKENEFVDIRVEHLFMNTAALVLATNPPG
jgi:demethylmenaquinone methyltransferase / 2-methoxy-6-polyprenyl-1,4-benzoquinol methylase